MEKRKGHGRRHLECEVFPGKQPEAAESEYKWTHCKKNPGHKQFLSTQDFKDNFLAQVHGAKDRKWLRSFIDLTVRLRVNYTSGDRPADDTFFKHRGSSRLRTGTGFVWQVDRPACNNPCPCRECGGEITRKHWIFGVRTARHVVFNSEEAERTTVDLFFDDESCERDGRMKSVFGVGVTETDSVRDGCRLLCVAHDEELGERIWSAWQCVLNTEDALQSLEIKDLLLPFCDKECAHAFVISHPHGQSKKITVGEIRRGEFPRMKYSAPTCPGSSGAPVVQWDRSANSLIRFLYYSSVHSGSYNKVSSHSEDQQNYGFHLWLCKPSLSSD